jgi:hypothetical protein
MRSPGSPDRFFLLEGANEPRSGRYPTAPDERNCLIAASS